MNFFIILLTEVLPAFGEFPVKTPKTPKTPKVPKVPKTPKAPKVPKTPRALKRIAPMKIVKPLHFKNIF